MNLIFKSLKSSKKRIFFFGSLKSSKNMNSFFFSWRMGIFRGTFCRPFSKWPAKGPAKQFPNNFRAIRDLAKKFPSQ